MIAGIFLRKQKKIDLTPLKDIILNTLNQFNTADKIGGYQNENVLLVQTTRFNTPESFFDPTPYIDQASGNVIVSWGILTNRDELAKEINLPTKELKETSDAEFILKSYLKWGENCPSHIYGDFSFVIYSKKDNSLFCCIDHMGVKPFYYYLCEDYFAFASTVSVFHNLRIIPMKPDIEWAAKYLLHLSMDFVKTAYHDIFKLRPANCLTVARDNHTIREYFTFNPEEDPSLGNIENYLQIYRELLNKAVSSRIRTKYNLGSETSGGIDSSTVTALAAKLFNQPIDNLYAFGFAYLEHEPQYILQVSQRYGIINNFICCGIENNIEDVKERALKILGSPVEHGNATFHTIFYKKAQSVNIRTLLSGFGGDEFVTTLHGNLALEQLMEEKKYFDLFRMLHGNSITRPLRFIKKYCKQKFQFKKAEFNQRFLNAWNQRWPYCVIKDEIIDAYDLKNKYFDTAKFDAGYTNINKFTLENRFAPFVPTRMGNCSLLAESYGIDYHWPLLDVRMIQFFLSIPSSMKYHRGTGRYFHRKAVDDFLPKGLNWKPNKYMGENVRENVREDFRENEANIIFNTSGLHDSLNQIVDTRKLDKLNSLRDSRNNKEINYSYSMNVCSVSAINHWLKTFH
ncbi:MAG TPA: asparagine synthetase B family protein [Lentisphaeria bacterium]|nr:MAG: hypothetical protein A2X47_04200 [Lentisphaerae bacterium GWF2_38_69]HBM16193.1 asparagine synthetase B family protein [Lentisphaeria bacterium]